MNSNTINSDPERRLSPTVRPMDHANTSDAVDISVLNRFDDGHLEGEPDMVVELIDLFLGDVPLRLTSLKEAMMTCDTNALRAAAHSLKGSSSSLGARQMARLCDELERNIEIPNSHNVDPFVVRVEQEFERVRTAFTAERRKRTS